MTTVSGMVTLVIAFCALLLCAAEPQSEPNLAHCQGRCGTRGSLCNCDPPCMYYNDCCEGFNDVCPEEVEKFRIMRNNKGVTDNRWCESDAVTPDDLFLDVSCEDRCGTKKSTEDLGFYPARPLKQYRNCSCDSYCGYYGNCCHDFPDFCPDEYKHYQELSSLYPPVHDPNEFACVTIATKTLVVDTCPGGSKCKFKKNLNDNANSFVPMYDPNRKIHYINGQCAVCNGAIDVVPWGVELDCLHRNLSSVSENFTSVKINSTDMFETFTHPNYACNLKYINPGEEQPCITYYLLESTCPDTCENQDLIDSCDSESQDVVNSNYHTYKNVHCALCNAGRWNQPSDSRISFADFSLTLVFDFNPKRGLTVGKHSLPECAAGEKYVRNEDACRPFTCPSGFVMDGSDCVPEPSRITVKITGIFSRNTMQLQLLTLQNEIGRLEKSIADRFNQIAGKYKIGQYRLLVNVTLEFTNSTVTVQSVIECNCDYSAIATEEGGVLGNSFGNVVEEEARNVAVEYLTGENLELSSVQASITLQLNQTGGFDPKLRQCTWLVYQSQEIHLENDTASVISTGRTYPTGMFEILEEVVIVCEMGELSDDDSHIENLLGLIGLICISISIVCLLIRVVLQFLITSFKHKPGKLQFNLTLAFLFAFIMVLVGPLVSNIPDACTAAAILLIKMFLAAFIWMNVIAVDTWVVFRPSAAFSRADDNDRSIIPHALAGWGISLIFACIVIILSYADVDQRFDPQFGGSRCFFTQRYAMLVCFGIPFSISIVVNLVLYVLTSLNLRKALQNSAKVRDAKSDFTVYVRLFILMGITWTIGLISAFTDEIVINFIHVILNSLQGLFIFVCFVCNKTVWSEIRQKVVKETSSSKSTSSSAISNNNLSSSSDV